MSRHRVRLNEEIIQDDTLTNGWRNLDRLGGRMGWGSIEGEMKVTFV